MKAQIKINSKSEYEKQILSTYKQLKREHTFVSSLVKCYYPDGSRRFIEVSNRHVYSHWETIEEGCVIEFDYDE